MKLFSLEAEQAVLSAAMLNSDLVDKLLLLSEDDFYYEQHKEIFRGIKSISGEINIFTVSECIDLVKIGGMEYLSDIADCQALESSFDSYVAVIEDRAAKRKMAAIGKDVLDSIEKGNLDEIIQKATASIEKINDKKEPNTHNINSLLKQSVDRIDELFHSDSLITGLDTGFDRLNDATSGFQAGDLVVIAARPSMGKTAAAMNICEKSFMSQNKPTIVFSLEMPAEQLTRRMLASLGRIDASRVRDGKLEEEDWPKLSSAVHKMQDKKIFIDDTSSISPNYLKSVVKNIAREHGEPALIMVDYLQLMSIKGFKEGRVAEISEISRSLKAIAKEFKCPVVALSQLNRGVEQRPNKRPVNSDLRESGAIEQDADLILFLYRDEYYNPETEKKGVAEVIIGKNRNGEVGQFDLAFIGRFVRFENLAHETEYD
ncbi:MAG: replicative DNA helicase [Parcubacteria group bacterium]|nr:replicative DNA helicase [Parcubacteria group bacterium]|tara:strand:+ start:25604 stop:26893 length:1290 start_codon:yes stop_codon:yes gene_type:complete